MVATVAAVKTDNARDGTSPSFIFAGIVGRIVIIEIVIVVVIDGNGCFGGRHDERPPRGQLWYL